MILDKVQIRRGIEANIPTLDDGEPGWTTDTFRLFIGQDGVNYPIGETASGVELDPTPDADHSVEGTVAPMVCGESLVFGEFCYIKSDGEAWKADANAATTMPVLCMATESGSADETKSFLFEGFARDDSWAWTPGALLYASAATAGALTETKPSGSGDQIQAVAIATHADRIWFAPDKIISEAGGSVSSGGADFLVVQVFS